MDGNTKRKPIAAALIASTSHQSSRSDTKQARIIQGKMTKKATTNAIPV
jgi:hypothetical protein